MIHGEKESVLKADHELDLRGEICPYTFIKSKLILEQMEEGKILERFNARSLQILTGISPVFRNAC